MLQACLNGKRTQAEHPATPYSAEELAADARAVREAGADTLHVHPRSEDGSETLEPALIARCLNAVRAAVPGMPVGVSTGQWIAPGGGGRLELIRAWEAIPDYASVNINEPDSSQTMEVLLAKGIGIEAGLWTEADARRFVSLPQAARCLRVLIEITHQDREKALAETRKILATLEDAGVGLPILLHGADLMVWPLVEEAKRLGHDTRVGLEDGLTMPDGTEAPDNRAIVEAAARVLGP